MLVALFLGGMVSTKVTDRPDRPGAIIHGVFVWGLFSLFTVWMIASGIVSAVGDGAWWRYAAKRFPD
jgi:hypothetical protein